MNTNDDLQRFLEAQNRDYDTALSEIKKGRKTSHWMWYIFPQIAGLGSSSTSRFYSIRNKKEAEQYLHHPVLGKRLIEISQALLQLKTDDAHSIFGNPDDMKLRSSMTLFAVIPETDPVFQAVLDKYFGGKKDTATLQILEQPK